MGLPNSTMRMQQLSPLKLLMTETSTSTSLVPPGSFGVAYAHDDTAAISTDIAVSSNAEEDIDEFGSIESDDVCCTPQLPRCRDTWRGWQQMGWLRSQRCQQSVSCLRIFHRSSNKSYSHRISSTTTIDSDFQNYVDENGRTYHGYIAESVLPVCSMLSDINSR